jgi:hypothetical protein
VGRRGESLCALLGVPNRDIPLPVGGNDGMRVVHERDGRGVHPVASNSRCGAPGLRVIRVCVGRRLGVLGHAVGLSPGERADVPYSACEGDP